MVPVCGSGLSARLEETPRLRCWRWSIKSEKRLRAGRRRLRLHCAGLIQCQQPPLSEPLRVRLWPGSRRLQPALRLLRPKHPRALQ
uniref:Homeobox A7 n=1 Tax=Mus musculus TaxID=10090 RepID=G3UZU9_MOUSE